MMGITKDEKSDLDNLTLRCISNLIQGRNYYQDNSYEKGDSNFNEVIDCIQKIFTMRKS